MEKISSLEARSIKGGEAITLTIVCATLAVSVIIIVAWKLYQSSKGSVTVPGGFKFSWSAFKSNVSRLLK